MTAGATSATTTTTAITTAEVCVPMCVCVCGTLGRDLDSMAHYLNDAGLAVKSHQ